MRNKGLTIVELLIAMALLAIIMGAVSAIFSVALKNYQVSFAQSGFQKEINLVTDSISRDIKQAVEIPESYNEYARNSSLMVLALPAINENEDFIYTGEILEKDYIIYKLNGSSLEMITEANPLSKRYFNPSNSKILLENVSELSFSYNPNSPGIETTLASVTVTISKTVSKTDINITSSASANKRNYE